MQFCQGLAGIIICIGHNIAKGTAAEVQVHRFLDASIDAISDFDLYGFIAQLVIFGEENDSIFNLVRLTIVHAQVKILGDRNVCSNIVVAAESPWQLIVQTTPVVVDVGGKPAVALL